MATDYPTAQFTGIDVVSLFPQEIRPANVNFKQEDVLTGLSFEDKTFDFVQMRLFGFQFNKAQWATSLKEAYRVTKPGGYIQLLEVQLMDPGNEMVRDFSNKLKKMMEGYDMDIDIYEKLQSILEAVGYSFVKQEKRTIPLENHILSSEFLYIIGISMEASKRFVMDMYDLHTREEFLKIKEKYVQGRKTTSESTWCIAAGQKPLN
ncbi:S-adenosyl-L-methionine-dependent methyltransferase [Backusella circina FSU 941]|nr:S-adenosyl-L-methionine-dependent methyltransferase [Backusella circina FSU 941]